MKTRLGPWIFGLLYVAVVAALILAINYCVRRASSLPIRAIRAHQPAKVRLLVRPIRPLPRGVARPRIAQDFHNQVPQNHASQQSRSLARRDGRHTGLELQAGMPTLFLGI